MADPTAAELARVETEKAIALTQLETLQIQAKYRALDQSENRRKRRAPGIELKSPDEEISGQTRLRSIAKARDTRQNYGAAKAAELQLGLNAIGTGPKVVVHLEDETKAEEWAKWFNGRFSKNCDGRGNRHLADQARIAMNTVTRDGDVLVYFEDTGVIPDAEGTLWYWEADQLPDLKRAVWKDKAAEVARRLNAGGPVTQQNGVVMDSWGRTKGYIVSRRASARGKSSMDWDEVSILPADACTLLYNPWRLNQRRGVSESIEVANLYQDLERFSEALIQRTITQSFMALKVKKKDGVLQARDRADASDNGDVPKATDDEVTEGTRYKNFEKLSMNAIEYMDPDEDVEQMQLAGDLPEAAQLIDFYQNQAGWANGLSAMYATGKADSSYSAAMAENNLTWALFAWWQKWGERYLYDWVAGKAFRWGSRVGKITPAPEALWLDNYSWHGFPKRLAINPNQEAMARKTDLSTGAATYADIWGPDWKKHLKLLGEMVKWSRDHGLFVDIFPTGAKSSPPPSGSTS